MRHYIEQPGRERWMGRFTHERFGELLAWLRLTPSVAECLHYPGMADVPAGFDRFAARDAKEHGYEWEDVCAAYALALVSKGSYVLPEDREEMEVLWDELGGGSRKLWPEVEGVVWRSWGWLDVHGQAATP